MVRWSNSVGFGVVAVALSLAGCASYVAPAAGEGFFAAPFRRLAPEAQAKLGPRPRRANQVASRTLASTPSGLALPLQKLAPGELPASGDGAAAGGLQPAALVEGRLRQRGVRFGTDGSVASLYAYMRLEQVMVPPTSARPGDVVFFQMDTTTCADHAGIVEAVDETGRITFREVRGGVVRESYAHPGEPSLRRAADGRVLNTFLRPRRTDDPPEARYFAGEMLCAVGRVRR